MMKTIIIQLHNELFKKEGPDCLYFSDYLRNNSRHPVVQLTYIQIHILVYGSSLCKLSVYLSAGCFYQKQSVYT